MLVSCVEMSLDTKDLYAIGVLPKICSEFGVGLDMVAEILAYYLWRPSKALLYYTDNFGRKLVKSYSISLPYDTLDYPYNVIVNDIFTFLMNAKLILNYEIRYASITVVNLQNHSYVLGKSEFINELINDRRVTSDDVFYVLHTLHNFSFELLYP